MEGGCGGAGQAVATETTLTDANGATIPGRSIAGGAGSSGGTVTLRASQGAITIAEEEGVVHIGDGEAIEVHGEDLFNTETPEELENAGGDSGDFVWGVDADGNSTWPDDTNTPSGTARSRKAGLTQRKTVSDLRRSGAKGGDGYVTPDAGGPVDLPPLMVPDAMLVCSVQVRSPALRRRGRSRGPGADPLAGDWG